MPDPETDTTVVQGSFYFVYNSSDTTYVSENGATVLELFIDRSLADLKITKRLHKDDTFEHQSFIFNITGPDGFEMQVVINADDVKKGTLDAEGYYSASVTIKDLKVGVYTVKEDTDWSSRYTGTTNVTYTDTDTVVNVGTTVITTDGIVTLSAVENALNEVKVTNTRTPGKWLDGYTQCTNLFLGTGTKKNYKD